MDTTLHYAGTHVGTRFSKLAIFALCVGALLVPTVWFAAGMLSESFSDGFTGGTPSRWALLGAAPGILGMVLAAGALLHVTRYPHRLRGLPLAVLGLVFAQIAAALGFLSMFVISLQGS